MGGELFGWMQIFLTGRKKAVISDGSLSTRSEVVSGMPQGTVLGPILFLIHIVDIDTGLRHTTALFFVDDTRVVMKIMNAVDVGKMQEDLQKYMGGPRQTICP